MRNSAANNFKVDLRPEIVKPFSSTRAHARYLSLLKGSEIEMVFAGWLFESGGYFSYLKNRMKKEARAGKLDVAKELARVGWPILIPKILKWIRSIGGQVVLVPIPSRFGSIEVLASSLAKVINEQTPYSCSVNNKLLSRRKELPIKRHNWKDRDAMAGAMYQLKNKQPVPKCIMLVDDVVSSGASLRRCAELLQNSGAERICAAVLAGDPDREENWKS